MDILEEVETFDDDKKGPPGSNNNNVSTSTEEVNKSMEVDKSIEVEGLKDVNEPMEVDDRPTDIPEVQSQPLPPPVPVNEEVKTKSVKTFQQPVTVNLNLLTDGEVCLNASLKS